MGRVRSAAAWLPAVVLVPATLVTAVATTGIDDPTDRFDAVTNLEPGTTWVYDVRDHGKPSGRDTRQVLGQAQQVIDGAVVAMTRSSSVYDNYPGRGPQTTTSYLSVDGDRLLQHSLVYNGKPLEFDPPAPALQLPAKAGTSISYDGTIAGNPYAYSLEVTDEGDVEVGGRTFADCAEYTTTVVPDEKGTEPEVLTEWTCPGVGVVRSHDVWPAEDVDITEELVAFHGRQDDLVLGELPDPVEPPEPGTEPASDQSTTVSALGFGPDRRSWVADGRLGRDLAWSEYRQQSTSFPPVSDGATVVVGERDGLVSARDVTTGELRWQVTLVAPIVATPTLSRDVVVVSDGTKTLWALSLRDGTARWAHTFDDVVSATPAADDDVVAVPVDDGSVVGLDSQDGEELWSAQVAGLVRQPLALNDGVLVVADDSGAVTALGVDDGAELWSQSPAQGTSFGPSLGDGRAVVVDGEGVVVAYDLDDGERRWLARGTSAPDQPVAVTDDVVVTLGDTRVAEAFDLDDGERLWERRVPEAGAAPAVVGDEVLVAGADGTMTVLDVADGSVIDSWDLPRPLDGSELSVSTPLGLVGGDVVVQASIDGVPGVPAVSFAYPTATAERARGATYAAAGFHLVPGVVNAAPVLDGGDVYALGFDQVLYRSPDRGAPAALVSNVGTTVGLAAGDGVVVVPHGEEVWGVDGATGDKLWALPTGEASAFSLPAVADGSAYVPIRDQGLLSVELRSGAPRWVAPVDGLAGTSTPLPLPGGDVLYAASGLTSYDGDTGDVGWQLGGDLADAVAFGPVAADRDNAYALLTTVAPTGEESTTLVAADLGTGKVRWRHAVPSGVFGIGPAAGSGVVVYTDGRHVLTALDAADGSELWTYQMASEPGGNPVVVDGTVQVLERGRPEDIRSRAARFVSLDLRTGRYLASFEPPAPNDVVLPTVGSGPAGQLLIPNTSELDQNVLVLEVQR